jgi:hypothetical protein
MPQQGPMGKIDRNGGAYFQELSNLNWLVLLPVMSPDPVGVVVPFDFQNFYFLLTYLLTSLFGTYPQISGSAAAVVTKLRGLNDSPLGGKTAQLGRNRKISNTTSGPVGQSSTQKRLARV